MGREAARLWSLLVATEGILEPVALVAPEGTLEPAIDVTAECTADADFDTAADGASTCRAVFLLVGLAGRLPSGEATVLLSPELPALGAIDDWPLAALLAARECIALPLTDPAALPATDCERLAFEDM